jgi:hypothetical protein
MVTATKAAAANATSVKTARPGTKPAIHVDAKVPSVLDGVTAPVKETAKTKAARALAEATANAKNPFELAAIKAGPLAVGAKPKAPKAPKPDVSGAKNDLAARITFAAAEMIRASDESDQFRSVMSIDDALKLASQWLHYLPVGATWPGSGDMLPVPERSEWNADGTRV